MRMILRVLFVCLLAYSSQIEVSAQMTPLLADDGLSCTGDDCNGTFNWSRVQDGNGDNIPNIAQSTLVNNSCNSLIEAEAEYVGAQNPNLTGSDVGTGGQGGPFTDQWTFTFSTPLTNPVIDILNGTLANEPLMVSFTDCDGNPIAIVDLDNQTTNPAGQAVDIGNFQLLGTFDCVMVTAVSNNPGGDTHSFRVRTCLNADPLPPCVECAEDEQFQYISLANRDGSGTGATADVFLGGVLFGFATVIESNLTISEDLTGTAFGAFANGLAEEETLVLEIELCQAIAIQQLDIIGLETESQAWIGTSLGAGNIPAGLALTQCGGPPTMAPTGTNMVTNVSSSCSNQGNGNYTVGGVLTDLLYFRYTNPANPPGSCSFDLTRFSVGTCISSLEDAIPECPLTVFTITEDEDAYVANILAGGDGSAFTRQIIQDANGRFFSDANNTCGEIQNDIADVDGNMDGDLDDLVDVDADGDGVLDPGNAIAQVAFPPCATVVDEGDCSFCTPTPPCEDCPAGQSPSLFSLSPTGSNPNPVGGPSLLFGNVFLNGLLIGEYEFLFSDVDVSNDGSGVAFGAFDNDGGVMLMSIDFCEPTFINQIDIRGLESQSIVSVGTTISGAGRTATLGGQTFTLCQNPSGNLDQVMGSNMITNASGSCRSNDNGAASFGRTVSTLFFRYENPTPAGRNCSFDWTGYQLHGCVSPPATVVPMCPIVEVEIDGDGDPATTGDIVRLARDVSGRFFNFGNACPSVFPTMEMIETEVSPCATVTDIGDCPVCVMPGLAKVVTSCVQSSSGIAGNADVTFKFTLTNAGGADMQNLQINDNIASLGGFVGIVSPPVVTMVSAGAIAPTPRAAYMGTGNLLNGTSGSLVNGQQIMVEVVAEFDPTFTGTSETNSATGGGTPPAPSTMVFLDESDNGTVPNIHNMPGDLDDPTPLQFPKINLSKEVTDVRPGPTPDVFLVDFALRVQNTGNVNLTNVVIEDNIAAQIGSDFVSMVTPPSQDGAFNGSSDIVINNIGTLVPNQTELVTFTILVRIPVEGVNQAKAIGNGVGPGGVITMVMDLSDAGPDPQSNNPGDPSVVELPLSNNTDNPTLFGIGVTLEENNMSSSVSGQGTINVTLDPDCEVLIPAGFGATGGNGSILGTQIFVDGEFRSSNLLTLDDLGRDIQYRTFDLSTGTFVWGVINLENKNIPDLIERTFPVMCLEPIPDLIDLDDFEDALSGACTAPISNLTETNTVTGDACTGFTRVRTIRGTVEIDGRKEQITLSVETINEMPLDVTMTECPAGIPNADESVDFSGVPSLADVPVGTALTIPCTVSNDADAIYAYFLAVFEDALDGQPFADERAEAAAIVRAYPHIEKDARVETVQTGTNTTTITTTVEDSMVLIDGVWVLADVVVKEDVTTPVFTDVTIPTLIPLPKTNVSGFQGGTICNLSVKCTDRNFPGCSGPQSKTRRDWQILNWCDGIVETHVSG